ncbi:hypothetical protein [Fulvivirga lutea]|uniref:DUF1579 domain-containing protein n=1 Tax=Fulvivirga lutea TaxID=2810512 RepID=A0A974WI17_9BACT|nr:hypothetical protein [Fulvivirga lutea]QSE96500.1 hypothetical protein JR347_12935 [Fulvivirga lutea]
MLQKQLLLCAFMLVATATSAQKQTLSEGLRPLAFTLGNWEFTWHHLDPQTRKYVDDGKAYSSVTLIHNGLTYADEFYKKNKDGSEIRGTTFRGYDPASKKLKLMWLVAGNLSYSTASGSKEGDNIVLYFDEEQNDQYGNYRVRITFYNITSNSYEWKQDFIYKDGTVVEKTMFYEAKRIDSWKQ